MCGVIACKAVGKVAPRTVHMRKHWQNSTLYFAIAAYQEEPPVAGWAVNEH